jgi:hypothetical protein
MGFVSPMSLAVTVARTVLAAPVLLPPLAHSGADAGQKREQDVRIVLTPAASFTAAAMPISVSLTSSRLTCFERLVACYEQASANDRLWMQPGLAVYLQRLLAGSDHATPCLSAAGGWA